MSSNNFDILTKKLVNAIVDVQNKKITPYDTQAQVIRVEDNTAWVHIPGGVDETPVQLTTNAKKGDIVQIRISGGQAWIVGNKTAPPTDDTKAVQAEKRAIVADGHATDAITSADIAKEAADIALEYAETAKETTDEIVAYAETAEKTVTQILNDGETAGAMAQQAIQDASVAKTSAQSASEYASRALGNLSTVQSIAETLTWITQHGTMTKTGDYIASTDTEVVDGKNYYTRSGSGTSADPYVYTLVSNPTGDPSTSGYYEGQLNPTHVYFVVNANGDYIVGSTHYSVVTEPDVADIGTYYELTIDESLNNYVGSHLALTNDGLYVMTNDAEWKVLVADDGVYIIDSNGSNVAKYKNAVTVGNDDDSQSYLYLDYHSMQLIDKESNVYFHISDLRNEDGDIVETFESDGNIYSFDLSYYLSNIVEVLVDDVSQVSGTDYWTQDSTVIFTYTPISGSIIKIIYETGDEAAPTAKAFTFGSRKFSGIGGYSFVSGVDNEASGYCSHAEGTETSAKGVYSHAEGWSTHALAHSSHAEGFQTVVRGNSGHAQGTFTIANGDSQTVIGSANIADITSVFIIGNGQSNTQRSNALTVDWGGNVCLALDTNAATGTTDGDLYAAIPASWRSEVIV